MRVSELGISGGPYSHSSHVEGWRESAEIYLCRFAIFFFFFARCTVKLGIFLNWQNEQSLYVRLSGADLEVAAFWHLKG